MVLDIPAWVARSPAGRAATGITTYAEAVQGTYINNDWFINNRNGNCKFLNVLQGENHPDADDWYDRMKKYCDTKIYGDRAFNGWSMGGQNMCDVHLVLRRLVELRYDGLLEKGKQDWMHFLGTSKLEWAVLLTDIQRAVRKHHNEQFTISFDCASPFLATANGQIYIQTETEDRSKWVYRMQSSADNKKYATDTRLFKDAVVQDGIFRNFESSPIIDQVLMNEICIYGAGTPKPGVVNPDPLNPADWIKPPDLNKLGKVSNKTSWDSFSYAIMMGHNVWMHVNAVQEANRQYDLGKIPTMLVQEKFNRIYFKDVVEAIFATSNKGDALAIVEDFRRYFDTIIGTRGNTGKKMTNASANFANLFDIVEDNTIQLDHSEEFTEDEENTLNKLEDAVKNDVA